MLKVLRSLIFKSTALFVSAMVVLGVFFISPKVCAEVSEPVHADARSIILCDMDTGRVLYEDKADIPCDPASTTKVMTALLVLEAVERGEITLEDKVKATQDLISGLDETASTIYPCLVDGEIMTVYEYLQAALIASDCIACDILGQYVSGSVSDFVYKMNTRATELGCERTNFVNTHGYPVNGHVSTARDMYKITMEALKHPVFVEIFGTSRCTIYATNKCDDREMLSTNYMMWDPSEISSGLTSYYYPFMRGGKTGSSSQAGHCITGYAQRGDVRLICVVLGAELISSDGIRVRRSFTISHQLYTWGFENFSNHTVLDSGYTVGTLPVNSGKSETVSLNLTQALNGMLHNDLTAEDLDIRIHTDSESITAPISAGTLLGTADIYYNGEFLGSIPLAAGENIEEGLDTKYIILIAAGITVVFAVVWTVIIIVILKKRSKKTELKTDEVLVTEESGRQDEQSEKETVPATDIKENEQ